MANNKNNGFVKLFRKQFDHPIWNNGKYDFGKAWLELWGLATHREVNLDIKKDGKIIDTVKLLPGQKYIFPETQAKRWGWSRTKVVGFLYRLTRTDTFKSNDGPMIAIDYPVIILQGEKRQRWGMRVTVMNWGLYQSEDFGKDTNKNLSTKTLSTKAVKQEVLNVFDYWNERKTIKHRSFEKFESNIKSALNNYSEMEIKESIRLYAIVFHEDIYWWNYPWTLREFLQRGLERFLPDSRPLDTYKKKDGGNQFEQKKAKLNYM